MQEKNQLKFEEHPALCHERSAMRKQSRVVVGEQSGAVRKQGRAIPKESRMVR